MKKLTGMKDNFASLENKKLHNLKSVHGGEETNTKTSIESGESASGGPGCSDLDFYKDGKWYCRMSSCTNETRSLTDSIN